MRATIIARPGGSEFSPNSLKEKGQTSMKETFINDIDALNALLACLSEHDLAALQAKKETFIDGTDALDALLACLSEHDLAALRARSASRLAEAKREMDQPHVPGKHDICHALVIAQNRRHLDTGSYEW